MAGATDVSHIPAINGIAAAGTWRLDGKQADLAA